MALMYEIVIGVGNLLRRFWEGTLRMLRWALRRVVRFLYKPIPYSRAGAIIQGVFFIIVWVLVRWYSPAPGIAVALLGLAAVLMAVRQSVCTKIEQPIWIVIALLLCIVEIRAIDKDRARAEQEYETARAAEEQDFKRVLQQNQKEFVQTLGKLNGLADLSIDSLDQVTGGNSYPYIEPSEYVAKKGETYIDNFGLQIFGKFPLHDVSVSILPQHGGGFVGPVDYGTVGPLEIGRIRQAVLISLKKEDPSPSFNIWINASNGPYYENVRFQWSESNKWNWTWAYRVWKGGSAAPPSVVLRTVIEPDFPNARRINWVRPQE